MTTTRLAHVADINPRGEKVSADDLVSFVGMAELNAMRAEAVPNSSRSFAEVSKGYTVFRDGDVLAAKITPCWENGKIGMARLDHKVGVGSTEFHVLRPRAELHDRFLLHFLRQPHIRSAGELRMTGSGGQRRIPVGFLQELQIRIPPLSEQRRIAAILDHADAIGAKRRQVLTHLDELGSAAFVERFGSRAELFPLGESLTFLTSGGRGWAKHYSAEGDRFIQSLDVQMGSISARDAVFVVPPENAEARRTRTAVGDVLLTITGSRIGRVAALPAALAGSFVSQHVAILRPDPRVMLPEFLAAMLALPSLGQHLIAGSQYGQTKPGLNFEQIRGFSLPRPPLREQRRFVDQLQRIASQRAAMTQAETSIAELFASLQSRAFRGEL